MAITPNTDLRLLKVPFTLDNKNQLTFNSKEQQFSYFNSLPYLEINEISYQRKDSMIRYPGHIDDILEYNYCMYQNSNYTDKWFYAFITDMKYENDGLTLIFITTDVFQTWQFDLNFKQSFVEREHVLDDTVGLHILDEGLNSGDLICDSVTNSTIIGSNSSYWFVIASNYDPSDKSRYAGVGSYAGYPQGNMWFAWDVNFDNPSTAINSITDWVFEVTKDGQDENIQTMFALPYQAFKFDDVDPVTHKVKQGKGNKLDSDITFDKTLLRTFDDFTPKNNKLFTYPYSFLRVTNNLGSVNDYKIEDFKDLNPAGEPTNNVVFNAVGVPCQGYSGKLRPKYYQGQKINEDESISLGKYPTLSWASDGFTNWMTQNSVNLAVNGITTAISSAKDIATGNIGTGILSSSAFVASSINDMINASRGSNLARGNANAGDVSFSQNIIRFTFLHMRPKLEYLKTLDNYFSMFGYKVNEVKIPNLKNRKNWNYVKTIDINLIANIPQEDLQTLRDIFNSGVTLWHNPNTFLDYSQDNT